MSPLAARPGYRLLRCPVCRLDLTVAAGALVCRNRHSFDLAREGYVNLLRPMGGGPASGGDSSEQLRHREAFLDSGHFDLIAATIVEHVRQSDTSAWSILDAGFGTGYHLANIAKSLSSDVVGLGLDISRDAVRRASRCWPILAFAVADLWTEWPVQDATVDLLLGIFAPKNFPGAARVLRPGGWLAVVCPGPDHMIELRDRFGLMRRHEAAGPRYTEAVKCFVGIPTIDRLRRRIIVEDVAIRGAILMGPNARHIPASELDSELGPMAVTLDFILLFARKREGRY